MVSPNNVPAILFEVWYQAMGKRQGDRSPGPGPVLLARLDIRSSHSENRCSEPLIYSSHVQKPFSLAWSPAVLSLLDQFIEKHIAKKYFLLNNMYAYFFSVFCSCSCSCFFLFIPFLLHNFSLLLYLRAAARSISSFWSSDPPCASHVTPAVSPTLSRSRYKRLFC